MTRDSFIADLKALGHEPAEAGNGFVTFDYEVQVGRLAGRPIKLGLQLSDMNPPPGPHITPRLMPFLTQGHPHPDGGIHASPLGGEWQYWSRPYSNWNLTDRTGRTYMAHI